MDIHIQSQTMDIPWNHPAMDVMDLGEFTAPQLRLLQVDGLLHQGSEVAEVLHDGPVVRRFPLVQVVNLTCWI